jgi:hypothetical protein
MKENWIIRLLHLQSFRSVGAAYNSLTLRSEVLSVITTKMSEFRDVTPCCQVESYPDTKVSETSYLSAAAVCHNSLSPVH